jgi:arsenate reductase (thioredoxin)
MMKILFVCIHNSARSQMAEAFVNRLSGGLIAAQSAGLTPGALNPAVVEVMKEEGIDISGNQAKSIDGFIQRGERFDYVVTVCDEASAAQCPSFPGKTKRLHWSFEDPSSLQLSGEEKLDRIRMIRDAIKAKVIAWLALND